eukprot:3932824-Rhodomonas_salina.1
MSPGVKSSYSKARVLGRSKSESQWGNVRLSVTRSGREPDETPSRWAYRLTGSGKKTTGEKEKGCERQRETVTPLPSPIIRITTVTPVGTRVNLNALAVLQPEK